MDIKEKILNILNDHARISDEELGVRAGISGEEAKNIRVALEEDGIIRKYKAVINRDKQYNSRVFAFIDCKVTPSKDVGFDKIAQNICKYSEVHSAYLVSGAYDLRVVVEGKDLQSVAMFVAERLACEEGITSVMSNFLLRTYKEDRDILFEPVIDHRLSVSP